MKSTESASAEVISLIVSIVSLLLTVFLIDRSTHPILFRSSLAVTVVLFSWSIIMAVKSLHASGWFAALRRWYRYRHCFVAGRAYFSDTFSDYCNACVEMLRKASADTGVMTIQTPVPVQDPPGYGPAFQRYLEGTCDLIISRNVWYRRLVIIDPNLTSPNDRDSPESKAQQFLELLVDTAIRGARRAKVPPSLQNVLLGFVPVGAVPRGVYGNLDIHLCNETDFAIAFLTSPNQDSNEWFGGSIHMRDQNQVLCGDLRDALGEAWQWTRDNQTVIKVGEFGDLRTMDVNQTPVLLSDDEKRSLIESLRKAVMEKAAKARNMSCACPVRFGVQAVSPFVKQLLAKNPATVHALLAEISGS